MPHYHSNSPTETTSVFSHTASRGHMEWLTTKRYHLGLHVYTPNYILTSWLSGLCDECPRMGPQQLAHNYSIINQSGGLTLSSSQTGWSTSSNAPECHPSPKILHTQQNQLQMKFKLRKISSQAISVSSRPTWCTEWVPGQQGTQRETLSQTNIYLWVTYNLSKTLQLKLRLCINHASEGIQN